MRQRDKNYHSLIRKTMKTVGIFLLFLLVWKEAGIAAEQADKDKIMLSVKEGVEKGFLAAWSVSYPGAETDDGETELNWLDQLMAAWFPALKGWQKEEKGDYEDPAYREYLAANDFYREHPGLSQTETTDSLERETGENSSEEGALDCITEEENQGRERGEGQTFSDSMTCAVSQTLPITGTTYRREQLADYDFLMKHFYSVHTSTTAGRDLMKADVFLDEDFALEGDNSKPQILIYHTHSQETFADYGPDNPEATVVGIGSYMTQLLTDKGYNVIHDTSVYDMVNGKLDRSQAYNYALDGISRILRENPSIEVVLDVHRDGVDESVRLVTEVGGKPTAQIMFFNGISQTPDGPVDYLPNPNREKNLAFSFQLQLNAQAYFPGYTRKIYIKGLRYNLHVRPRSALIEVGAQNNTYEEARNAMEPLAELLDMVLQGN